LWSFMMSTAHGAGLMLVPALIPLCMGDASAREITASGSLALALAAVAVHTAAMLAVTGVIATGVCRGFDAGCGRGGQTRGRKRRANFVAPPFAGWRTQGAEAMQASWSSPCALLPIGTNVALMKALRSK